MTAWQRMNPFVLFASMGSGGAKASPSPALSVRAVRALVFFSLSLSLFGCNVSNEIKGHIGIGSSGNDFGRSEIIVSGSGIADGETPLYILIRLINSDGRVVANYRPDYQILSGAGVTGAPCTYSDINGVSVCAMRANSAGTKTMRVTNTGTAVSLQKNFDFLAAAGRNSVVGFSSSGAKQELASGYLVHASVSGLTSSIFEVTGGGYKVYSNLQGKMDGD
ncbi:MAG: hypothetical protein IPK68_07160 [Bdellovibrionales bacterium]|nr:hypothetical protein [Bdellovibrionales bacterium]